MGLRAKFNLMLLGVALAGIALFALASTPVLNDVAKNEVEQNSRIMMDAALGARQYTSQEIAPLLAARHGQDLPSAVGLGLRRPRGRTSRC